jgi:hypothetical protein
MEQNHNRHWSNVVNNAGLRSGGKTARIVRAKGKEKEHE